MEDKLEAAKQKLKTLNRKDVEIQRLTPESGKLQEIKALQKKESGKVKSEV